MGTGKILIKPVMSINTIYATFRNCTKITTIPSGIFDNCKYATSAGFYSTFYDCTALTSVPSN